MTSLGGVAAGGVEDAGAVGEERGALLEQGAAALVEVAIHGVEAAEDDEVGAPRTIAVEEGPSAEEVREVVEAALELGAGSALARVEDLGLDLAVLADQAERPECAGRAARRGALRGFVAATEARAEPARDVEDERLAGPGFEPQLLARDARVGRDQRRLRKARVEQIED